jgi:hypothetical protein
MIVVNMPGGAVQSIGENEIFWFRRAFASEWDGATMIRLAGDRIYSIESVADLSSKFAAAGVKLATFTAPDARLKVVVSASRVRQVDAGNPAIYHEKAESVLEFSMTVRLAVRENPAEAREKLKNATSAAGA